MATSSTDKLNCINDREFNNTFISLSLIPNILILSIPKSSNSSRIFCALPLNSSSLTSPYNKILPIVSYLIILLIFGFSESSGKLNILSIVEVTSDKALCISVSLTNSILNCANPSLAVEFTFLTPSITLNFGSIDFIILFSTSRGLALFHSTLTVIKSKPKSGRD